ncbi:hypothetical protein [Mycoplasma parvum]|uniref:Uncharacterized protein n=1 Tax=Mycoplasma parvum str. Indiana TaxID=1403316 RepID=U5NC26_9MOLU|nr:hypothetical protein [Mycoplasma parvum]AGX88962.1 hypothetical protein PRV_00985 [Mycoplasma parvum str. Indiana]
MKVDKESFKEESLTINSTQNLQLNEVNLNEKEKSEKLRGTVSQLVIEMDKETDTIQIQKEQQEEFSKVSSELKQYESSFQNASKVLKPSIDYERSRSRSRRDEHSAQTSEVGQLSKQEKKSVSIYYQKYINLKNKKEEFTGRLEKIKKGIRDSKNGPKIQTKNEDQRILNAIKNIEWDSKDNIEFEKFIQNNRKYWDSGNPYGSLLTLEQWNSIVEVFKDTVKKIRDIETNGTNRFCSLVAMIFRMSEHCFQNRNELKQQKEILKKLISLAIGNKLLQEMELISKEDIKNFEN